MKYIKEINTIRKFTNNFNRFTYIGQSEAVSYSQISMFTKCPHKWKVQYVDKAVKSEPSIHTAFGTAFHETLQESLDILFNQTISKYNEYDYEEVLYEKLRNIYKKDKEKLGKDFSSPSELKEFYDDGLEIFEYLKKKRKLYFDKKKHILVGCEIPIAVPLPNKVYFNGYIDVLLYDKVSDSFLILDIKTSTKGWNSYQKKDFNKVAQILLYKNFLSEQFNIPLDDISVEFLIVKRKVPSAEDVPYSSMRKRVQEYKPSDGKVNVKKARNLLDSFITESFDQEGKVLNVKHVAIPSTTNCKFCILKDRKDLCKVGISS